MTTDAQNVTKSDGVDRRTVVKAAAWAAPVIAVAAATPLAAASPQSSALTLIGTDAFTYNGTAGSYNLTNGAASITNSGSGWNISRIQVVINWAGPVQHTGFLVNGATRANGDTFDYAGYTWVVVSNTASQVAIRLNTSITVGATTVLVPVPPITGSTTLTATPDEFNQAGTTGTLSVTPSVGSAVSKPIGSLVG